jgi:hypothetical protein
MGLITAISGSEGAGCITILTAALLALWLLYGLCWLMARIWFTDQDVGWEPPTAALAGVVLTAILAFRLMSSIPGSSDRDQKESKTSG